MSSAPFPGAPVNTDPISTVACSSADPITSPSTASSVPHTQVASGSTTQAPSSVPGQPAPSSVGPRSAAPEDARAVASVPGQQERTEAATTDPSTSATATAGAPTVPIMAISGAMTTTTSVTGTTATAMMMGRTSPVIPTQTLFNEAIARCNNCLFLIRKLRAKQDNLTEVCLGNRIDGQDFYGAFQAYKDFGVIMQEVMHMYEKLDYYARRLPKVVPPIDNINMMRTLYTQEHTMNHTNINNLIEKMIDSGNWNEGNYQIFYYLSELLRVHGQRKKYSVFDAKPLPLPIIQSHATTGHFAFENAYRTMKKEIVNKSLGIYPRTLQRTACSLVIEFQFGCGAAKAPSDKDVVYTMKFLLVERCGVVEFINMVATHEDWDIYNDYGRTTVNPFTPSRFEVYRRLTKQANVHLYNCFGTHASRWTANTLIQFVSLFGKFREVFTTRCRICKHVLKNFLPPLVFDIRSPSSAYHDTCR